MTSCSQIAERATDLAEGALVPAERAELEAHLAGCERCRTFVAQLELTSRALRALPPPTLPAALRSALLGDFAWRRAWRFTVRFAAAVASAALLLAGSAGLAGEGGGLEASTGLHCLLVELGWTVGAGGAAWWLLRRAGGAAPAAGGSPGWRSVGTWALAGALAADGFLQFRCAAAGSRSHALLFHAGGVVLVALVALAAAHRRPRRAVQ